MPVVTVGNAQVHYTRTGTGPALVLVHGTGSAGAELTWGGIAHRFADRHTVIMPDLSGTDRTSDDGAPLTVEGLAEQVAAVIEDAVDTTDGAGAMGSTGAAGTGAGPAADVLGFSMGAPVAAALAASRPDLVRRLVMVAGWVRTDADEYVRNLFTLWRRLGTVDAEAFGRSVTMTGFSRDFLNAIGRDEVEKLVPNMPPTPGTLRHVDLDSRVDIRRLLPLVRAETLVVGCSQDATVPVGNSRDLHAAIPGSAYAEIDAGHVVFFEKPDEFVGLVRDFLVRDFVPAP
ncbi:3-oxoadipate enol-lactone hydrolase or 4-carboxymuconolactone decarboxylase [Planomonospora sphaerica]|uniref:3-oxoadipate enol-lactone hydrolase or 4-carboxymuconolactone decarboxylase n=1 Tax=Planomonospora sphaerica TaxID=161355 RepID=A0A171D8D1_9ACTN|nr:alpha/beta hydrolase [Planomonospora sphaerica]GAT67797.1 3-oxoadipate enol-lactone hydrolase or 4-carboxymuconolactone decarboxylase [Planomonospora sphaerica]